LAFLLMEMEKKRFQLVLRLVLEAKQDEGHVTSSQEQDQKLFWGWKQQQGQGQHEERQRD